MKNLLILTSVLLVFRVSHAQNPERPQQPKGPFPYVEKEVEFASKAKGVTLAGTLTLPAKKGKFPLVILVSGSGPQDRNESLLGHQPFAVIADYLSRNGIAVLRYDDRGIGKSTGNFMTSTSADFADDAEGAVLFALKHKNIDPKAIGIAGHSEGGIIAPMVAERNQKVGFVVMLAGPGLKGSEILLMQQELIGRAMGAKEEELQASATINGRIFALMDSVSDDAALKAEITTVLKQSFEDLPDSLVPPNQEMVIKQTLAQLVSPWMRYFVSYDPYPTLTKVKCPILALNGKNDLQVPCDANLEAIQRAAKEGGNEQVTVMALEKLNHLFQESETGSPDEYMKIEQTFSPVALEAIRDWILLQTIEK